MSESPKAVFLSYASQDTEAVQRICDALRSAGVEVWFDRNELRGGDAWDASIRKQIKECALFVPVISSSTNARSEGYFRLEWKLAIDRSHLMADDQPFLLPVVIDDTPEAMARVPDRFRERQWSRLVGGETPPVFAERVKRLLSGGAAPAIALSNPRPVRRSRVLIAALIIVAAGTVAGFYIFSHQSSSKAQSSSTAPASPAIPEKSIAVLPMVNSSGDPANEYFSDGMSEEFISSLSRLHELKVVGRVSSFQFKGKTDDSKTIGEKLGVYYLLEGSVQRSADRVRIWVELIKSGDGATLWSESYDRDLNDIFAMQSEIARTVAKELKVALLGNNGQTTQLATAGTPSTQSVEAYNAFLQGNFYSKRVTAEDTSKAIGYYEEAIRLDARYALAYAKLSIQAGALANNYSSLANKEKQEVTAKARAAAERSLQLDPNLAEAHMAKGYVLHLFDFDFAGAEAEFRRALELAPQDPGAAMILASLLATLGRLDEAVTLEERAIVLDPLRSGVHANLAAYLTPLGRYDEAEAALRKAIALHPQAAQNHLWLAIIQILRGQPGSAVELAKQETDPFWRTYALAQAYFAHGDRAEAEAELKKMIDTDADGAGVQIAEVYALRKEPDKMFEWLDHGWSTQDPGVAVLLFDPFLGAYKDNPRFITFARKIGVMPKAATHP